LRNKGNEIAGIGARGPKATQMNRLTNRKSTPFCYIGEDTAASSPVLLIAILYSGKPG